MYCLRAEAMIQERVQWMQRSEEVHVFLIAQGVRESDLADDLDLDLCEESFRVRKERLGSGPSRLPDMETLDEQVSCAKARRTGVASFLGKCVQYAVRS